MIPQMMDSTEEKQGPKHLQLKSRGWITTEPSSHWSNIEVNYDKTIYGNPGGQSS